MFKEVFDYCDKDQVCTSIDWQPNCLLRWTLSFAS